MMNDSIPLNFKEAVFVVENAFLDGKLDHDKFNSLVNNLAKRCQLIADQSILDYKGRDVAIVKKYASVFRLMTDTIQFTTDSLDHFTIPYKYDFDDFMGEKDWSKMFVFKLLTTHTGNCHSLPFLYKILCEELGVKAYLSMAPNHIYIKLRCEKIGWYNTELTSGYFPIDAWIMASGYVHLTAVQNRIYMDTLSDKQSIAVCITDLVQGYQRKHGEKANYDDAISMLDFALRFYPNYINALLLKAETMKKKFELEMRLAGAQYPSDIYNKPDVHELYNDMQNLYFHIHRLGYRKMPPNMYLDWLADLKVEKQKFLNQKVQFNTPTK